VIVYLWLLTSFWCVGYGSVCGVRYAAGEYVVFILLGCFKYGGFINLDFYVSIIVDRCFSYVFYSSIVAYIGSHSQL
jgi:hypothetical protein